MKKLLLILIGLIASNAFSQNKSVTVKYISETITLDGVLNEPAWATADIATNFWQYFPTDSLQATQQAEIKMLFDDTNLYVGIKVNAPTSDFVIPSLRRDFRAGGNDNITLLFDTFNDGTNAIIFGTNPEGVQREMLLSGGGTELRGFNMAWDAKWKCETKIHDDHYIIEWIIPLFSFKYREGETKWRFNSYHFDTQANENNTWVRIPQNQNIFSLAYMGEMIFEKPLGKSKSPIAIIPYINALVGEDYENNETVSDFKYGGDARMTIKNSMNLDLTINPDFSQVEVDRQVTNLTRFEIGLPERRQFFIENADLFNDFGSSRDANPFFSRRIGIARDLDDNNIQNDIIAGLRLSGKLNNNLRIGILNMQTEEDVSNEIAASNNAVVTAQLKTFSRSNLSMMFINKQATKDYDFLPNEDRYNRVVGLDYRMASADNTWVGKYFFHKSFSPDVKSKDFSAGASTEYNVRNYQVRLSGVYVGDNYRSDLGFIRRTDIFKINPSFQRNFWPKTGKIQQHSLEVIPIFIWRPTLDFENSDYTIISRWDARFTNTSSFQVEMFNRYTKLYDEFDPTRSDDGIPLPADTDYYYTDFGMQYRSDQRKELSYSVEPSYGKFYNGNKFSFQARLNYRWQPHFIASLDLRYDSINLPEPYSDASIWLIGPRIDITFNKKLFWATLIQYSTQQDNFSINSRLQWRFAPLSDLFVVYNDNYFVDNRFAPRVRSLNLKLTYWLNL
ncbi:MAG: carbohydrate binding family 9 domain-containing protein [Flavobacteriaceae bacterium]|nr:carbohydrate binding family 9 domain-containing protein [Flavobacteriaceae bacterium]